MDFFVAGKYSVLCLTCCSNHRSASGSNPNYVVLAIMERNRIASIIIACRRMHIVTQNHCATFSQNIVIGALLEYFIS